MDIYVCIVHVCIVPHIMERFLSFDFFINRMELEFTTSLDICVHFSWVNI